MTISFDDKVAVITGAGNGLGRSYALFLASRGASVLVNDSGTAIDGHGRTRRAAQQVVEEIRSHGGRAAANFDSVAEPEGASRMVQDAVDHFGTVDILINNAGILKDKSFIKMSQEDFDDVVKVHLLGTVYVTRAAFAVMKARTYGRIVMTTSVAGLFGNFGQTNYSAAKMGVVGFMNTLKLEGRKYNIIVNTVAPLAATRMAISTGVFPTQIVPFLKPELVTPVVAYLCSEACGTSGAVIAAGGGYFANVRMVEGPGVRFDPKTEITPETIAENYGAILDMRGAAGFESTGDELQAALGPLLNLLPKE